MKISYNWLKEFVEIEKTPEQLGDDLSLFGHEIEAVEKIDNDYVLDFEITPNRGDCLSILGMAREVAALYNSKLKTSTFATARVDKQKLDKSFEIKIEKPAICPRYTARIINNLQIGESPKWMQEKLATYGFRPINNIVDVTNYVMVVTGQPLHAFDFDKIDGAIMNIRLSKKGEEVMTLDGQNRILPEGAIIIEDTEKIYDLAGIMGGIKSEVDENTKTIILQGAIFDPVLIRKASKYLNHTTDASYRYERGVDYNGTILGVDMAASLINESCPDAKLGEILDICSQTPKLAEIELDINRVNHLLGTDINMSLATDYLKRLGFEINDKKVSPPSYRAFDIKIWQDVAEEIARIYSYNKIPRVQIKKSKSEVNIEFQKREAIKDTLEELGFTEIYSYSFAERDKIEPLGGNISDSLEVANPLSDETQYLRPSILPSLVSAVAKNPWSPEANIFEIEAVFDKGNEKWQLGMATAGKSKSMLAKALSDLEINAEIKSVEQKSLDRYKIRRQVNYVLVDIDNILGRANNYSLAISRKKYRPISSFAPTVRDLSFIVDNEVKASEVIKQILATAQKVLLAEVFDEYSSEKFGPGKKNLAFHIWMQNQSAPMSQSEVDEQIKKIVEVISAKFSAKIRAKE